MNLTTAADQGAYTTRVAEDELFIDGRELRCDLFFCANGAVQQVAPRGTKVKQELQPVVWQFSGLLPVSDYLRTVAIHSVATEQKVRPWQDVQKTFYDGLLVEGANDADAKIAFAGAYAFAPRWSLVEFTEVEEDSTEYPGTTLFSVSYTETPAQGMSVEDYRALALKILMRPEALSLQDIRETVDKVDFTQPGKTGKSAAGITTDANNAAANKTGSLADGTDPVKPIAPIASVVVDSLAGGAAVGAGSTGVNVAGSLANESVIAGKAGTANHGCAPTNGTAKTAETDTDEAEDDKDAEGSDESAKETDTDSGDDSNGDDSDKENNAAEGEGSGEDKDAEDKNADEQEDADAETSVKDKTAVHSGEDCPPSDASKLGKTCLLYTSDAADE